VVNFLTNVLKVRLRGLTVLKLLRNFQMGRMSELAYEREQIEQEIAIARMEAEHEAIPNSLAESNEMIKTLRSQLSSLATSFEAANSPKARNKERALGFGLGVLASLLAALVWLGMGVLWPILK
jgi:hypothetical protein